MSGICSGKPFKWAGLTVHRPGGDLFTLCSASPVELWQLVLEENETLPFDTILKGRKSLLTEMKVQYLNEAYSRGLFNGVHKSSVLSDFKSSDQWNHQLRNNSASSSKLDPKHGSNTFESAPDGQQNRSLKRSTVNANTNTRMTLPEPYGKASSYRPGSVRSQAYATKAQWTSPKLSPTFLKHFSNPQKTPIRGNEIVPREYFVGENKKQWVWPQPTKSLEDMSFGRFMLGFEAENGLEFRQKWFTLPWGTIISQFKSFIETNWPNNKQETAQHLAIALIRTRFRECIPNAIRAEYTQAWKFGNAYQANQGVTTRSLPFRTGSKRGCESVDVDDKLAKRVKTGSPLSNIVLCRGGSQPNTSIKVKKGSPGI
jgi:hypothetical protein